MRKDLLVLLVAGLLGSSALGQQLTTQREHPSLAPMKNPQVARCDETRCYTPIGEVHADGCATLNEQDWVYSAPPGVKFVDVKGAVEIEGSGATHYVNAVSAGPSWLECKWHAEPKCLGDNGLSKGYCWVEKAK